MSSQEEHNKLTDEEKFKLIEFYKENSELWVTQGITRSQKVLQKEELAEEFDRKFSIEILEKALHALRASFLREHKKYQKEGQLPNKGWKFYESMLFMKNEPNTNKVTFTSEERETLITFYQTNPVLWNHGMIEYRDPNIRRALIQKFFEEFVEKFTEDEIKKEWNVFLTRYRHERQTEKVTRSTPSGIDDVFDSNWEHFQRTAFLKSTPGINSPLSTLDKCEITPPVPKKSKASQESDARAALYIALAKSFDKPTNPQPNTSESKKCGNSIAERANLFGNTAADNLLQCDPKDWTLTKKKIFDLFFDNEQGDLTPRITLTTPFNNYNNFTFPNVAEFQSYGYTGQMHAQQQNNQSSSGFQDYGYNNQTQLLQRKNQP